MPQPQDFYKDRTFRCPTLFESFCQTALLWPRGRAWPIMRTDTPSRYWAWLAALGGLIPNRWPTGFVQAGYTAAIAFVRNFIETRLCALRLEFWCFSHSETHDQWLTEYGLPDECDPFPDLCTKVAAIGGTRCEYYAEVAARAGWSITCTVHNGQCGATMGCAQMGCDETGSGSAAFISIDVFLNESPSYVAAAENPPYAGNFQMGFSLACEPDITPLKCILDRVVHAHLVIEYITFGG